MKKKIISCFLALCIIFSYTTSVVLADTTISTDDFIIENNSILKYKGTETEVVIPEGIKSIGKFAFMYNEEITKVTLPTSITSIEDSAFSGCSKLESINFPEGLVSIGEKSFNDVPYLNEINLPNTLKTIGGNAFAKNRSVKKIVIPNSVTYIGPSCFANTLIEEAQLSDNLTNISVGLFDRSRIKSITLPKNINDIERAAFADCEYLQSVTMPDTVKSIGEDAFEDCKSLTDINFSKNLKSIGANAFINCELLENVDLNDSLESIGQAAFKKCISLTNIRIPTGVTTIEDEAFSQSALETVENTSHLVEIKANAFSFTKLSKIDLSNSIRFIGANSFYNCTELTNLSLKEGLEVIGDSAFQNCESITTVTIPSTVESLGNSVFYDCDNLNSADIKAGIYYIPQRMFYSCNSLRNVKISDSVTRICYGAFQYCNKLDNITLPDKLVRIEESAFTNAKISKLELPNTVRLIDDNAFDNCINLYDVTLPDDITYIGNYVFSKNTKLYTYKNSKTERTLSLKNYNYDIIGEITSIQLNYDNLKVNVFDKTQLIATINPDVAYDKTVKYKSSDENILKVDQNGLVTALNKGKATITATAANGLQTTCEFEVQPKTIYSLKDSITIENAAYSGSYITPNMTIYDKDRKLVEGVDYNITLSNNKNVGAANIVIEGIGNYFGTYNTQFEIVPKKTTSFTVDKTATSSVTLKWDKVASSRGYVIYRYNPSTGVYNVVTTIEANSTLTYTDSGLLSATVYKYRIKPIKRLDGIVYYGDYSEVDAVTKPLKATITLSSTVKGTVNISWKKVNRVTGYKVYRATSKTGTYSLIKTVAGENVLSYKNTNRTSSKYYYYKVRAYKTVDGKTTYGAYSDIKSIKVK